MWRSVHVRNMCDKKKLSQPIIQWLYRWTLSILFALCIKIFIHSKNNITIATWRFNKTVNICQRIESHTYAKVNPTQPKLLRYWWEINKEQNVRRVRIVFWWRHYVKERNFTHTHTSNRKLLPINLINGIKYLDV